MAQVESCLLQTLKWPDEELAFYLKKGLSKINLPCDHMYVKVCNNPILDTNYLLVARSLRKHSLEFPSLSAVLYVSVSKVWWEIVEEQGGREGLKCLLVLDVQPERLTCNEVKIIINKLFLYGCALKMPPRLFRSLSCTCTMETIES